MNEIKLSKQTRLQRCTVFCRSSKKALRTEHVSGAGRKSGGAEQACSGRGRKRWSGSGAQSGNGAGSGGCRNRLERGAAFSPLRYFTFIVPEQSVPQMTCRQNDLSCVQWIAKRCSLIHPLQNVLLLPHGNQYETMKNREVLIGTSWS